MEKQNALGCLAALAHETRLDVFRLLVEAGPQGLPAGAIADATGIPAATLSFHLKELKSAEVALCRREGRSLIYAPNFPVMNQLLAFLSRNCCSARPTRPRRPKTRRAKNPNPSTTARR